MLRGQTLHGVQRGRPSFRNDEYVSSTSMDGERDANEVLIAIEVGLGQSQQ